MALFHSVLHDLTSIKATICLVILAMMGIATLVAAGINPRQTIWKGAIGWLIVVLVFGLPLAALLYDASLAFLSPSPRNELLLLLIVFAAAVIVAQVRAERPARDLESGLARLKRGECALCGYPQHVQGDRCSECGFPKIDPSQPITWPRGRRAQPTYLARQRTAKKLYVQLMLNGREDVTPDLADAEGKPATDLIKATARACKQVGDWPNGRFLGADSWDMLIFNRTAEIKPLLEHGLHVRLTHAEVRTFHSLCFHEVVQRLTEREQLSERRPLRGTR